MTVHPWKPFARAAALVSTVLLAGCAIAKPRNDDPWERWNRKTFAFNQTMDKAVIRPVAVTYRRLTTNNMRRVVNNFFANVRMPITIANDLLQGSPRQAGRNAGRFLINTTLGFLGLFDPASKLNLPPDETDFGVTLAHWGVPEGPYLVLPFVGPTTARDVWRLPVDSYFFDPVAHYGRQHDFRYEAEQVPSLFYLVTLRSSAIDAEGLLDGVYDPYIFYRDAYRQRRLYDIYAGNPPLEAIQELQGIEAGFDPEQLLEEQQRHDPKQEAPSAQAPAAHDRLQAMALLQSAPR